ncbi:hypothetical protein KC19_N024400 [Ceratodon purpureus]|nr:hypothetical protein KC19_N024400 [Ceratodon purpureus]
MTASTEPAATEPAATEPNTSSLEMSLDQLIKHNKSMRRDRRRGGRGNRKRGRGGYGGPLGGPNGPFRNRQMKRGMYYRPNRYGAAAIPSKFTRQASSDHQGVWQHDMFEKVTEILPPFLRPLGIETGTKLYISNLDYAVSTDDIKELFSEVGDVKRCSINYDLSGRSKGTAEVVYSRKIDGVAALKRYNNVQLDGKAMKIEFIGSNLETPAIMPSATTTMAAQSASTLQVYEGHNLIGLPNQAPNRAFGMGNGTRGRRWWGFRGRGRGRGGRGRCRRRGKGGFRRSSIVATKTVAELDAELETYHSEAMET